MYHHITDPHGYYYERDAVIRANRLALATQYGLRHAKAYADIFRAAHNHPGLDHIEIHRRRNEAGQWTPVLLTSIYRGERGEQVALHLGFQRIAPIYHTGAESFMLAHDSLKLARAHWRAASVVDSSRIWSRCGKSH